MLKWNTVSDLLRVCLERLMGAQELSDFRLVGGTALSLYLGHRMSVDIDLFTGKDYGSVDFSAIERYMEDHFRYVDNSNTGIVGFGRSYFIGESETDNVKLDIYYHDPFIDAAQVEDRIRLATVADITAMKIDVVQRTGRKKDFWDLHELLSIYTPQQMIALHEQRYPYHHDRELIIRNFTNFEKADHDFNPQCLLGKTWELIKLEIIEAVTGLA